MTRRCFPYEIWRVFYNLARPVANSLVDGWKQFSSAQVQSGWVPHVYLGTRLLVLLFLLKESWYTRWKPLKIEYFFFLLEKKRQDSYWDFCLRGCVCFATWRQRIQSHMDLTVLSLSPHLNVCWKSYCHLSGFLLRDWLLDFCYSSVYFIFVYLKVTPTGEFSLTFSPLIEHSSQNSSILPRLDMLGSWSTTGQKHLMLFGETNLFSDFVIFLIIKVFAVEVRYFPSKNYVFFSSMPFSCLEIFIDDIIFQSFSKLHTCKHTPIHFRNGFFFFCFSNSNTLWRVPILSQST